ncbi:hypothetical protein PCE1_001679 [Barthelona sp. PCE]
MVLSSGRLRTGRTSKQNTRTLSRLSRYNRPFNNSGTATSTSSGQLHRSPSIPRPLNNNVIRLTDLEQRETIGTGTFGRVRLCQHTLTGKYYALKTLAKAKVAKLRQVEHLKSEYKLLSKISHPFIVNLVASFQDEKNVYLLQEYVPGGELFSHLRKAGRFTEEVARFFAAEIVLALEYLHSQSIVYRDLKPENLLLDSDGHMKICDFGFAKVVTDRTYTVCGTPEYLAPEIIQARGHNKAVDWWALGILIFEMLVGYPPFCDENPFLTSQKIMNGKIWWARHVSPTARDLIKRLLARDRTRRFGNLRGGAEDIKRHRFFRAIDWNALFHRRIPSPLVPPTAHEGDTSHFDNYAEEEEEVDFEFDQQDFADF